MGKVVRDSTVRQRALSYSLMLMSHRYSYFMNIVLARASSTRRRRDDCLRLLPHPLDDKIGTSVLLVAGQRASSHTLMLMSHR